MTLPRALDLFCGAGGASMGYHLAGFDVTGVDLQPQRHYPFTFVQGDALTFPLDGFDLIHASPPCQDYSSHMRHLAGAVPRLIEVTRDRLTEWGGTWVIENVEGSGLPTQDTLDGDHGLVLCGAMFGARMYRHRLFETSHPVPPPHHPRHDTPASRAGHWEPGTFVSVAGHCGPAWLVREAMGIDWATLDEIAEAIPPAFTRYIGEYLVERLRYSSQRKEV